MVDTRTSIYFTLKKGQGRMQIWIYPKIDVLDEFESSFIYSFIQAISIAPLQVRYYSEALLTQHGYRVGVSSRSATGNCEWRTCPRSLHGGENGIRTCDPSFIPAISIAALQVLYCSEALPTTARIGVSRRSAQATAGKGLAQGPYVAVRAGFQPATLRTKSAESISRFSISSQVKSIPFYCKHQ